MARHHHLYQRAVYYDVVFDRDVKREVDFISALCEQHMGHPPHLVLDVACGPGYHARAFARCGIPAIGLDLRPEMTDLAREKDAAEGLTLTWIAQDMRDFVLERPVDAAFIMFDGLDALVDNDDLIAHFQATARNLTPGGLYVIDLTHPREVSLTTYYPFRYHGERDGITVDLVWATNNPVVDPVTHVAHTRLEMHVDDHGERIVIEDEADERFLSAQEIALLARLSGALEVVGWYGDFDLAQPLDATPASKRMLAVLRRRN